MTFLLSAFGQRASSIKIKIFDFGRRRGVLQVRPSGFAKLPSSFMGFVQGLAEVQATKRFGNMEVGLRGTGIHPAQPERVIWCVWAKVGAK